MSNQNQIDKNTFKGLQTEFTVFGKLNPLHFAIEQYLRQYVYTGFLARIDSCSSSGTTGAKYVSATPLIAQTDGDNNTLPMVSIPKMPHYRIQQGIGALILDPVPGDIGIFTTCKQDISTVKQGTQTPQRAGSFREFSQSDAVMVGSVLTQDPQVWIHIKQDKTIVIHAPAGVTIETDADCTITCGGNLNATVNGKTTLTCPETEITGTLLVRGKITGQGGLEISGGTGATVHGNINTQGGDISADDISLKQHRHGGVQTGSGTTSTAQ